MKGLGLVLAFALAASAPGQQPTNSPDQRPRFCAVDIFIDSGTSPLSAYQLEFSADDHSAKIVGIEGGEHAAFCAAPYYDPKAIQQERVIVAAFNTQKPDRLPTGKTRVSTIHLQTTQSSQLQFKLKVQVAADANGKAVVVEVTALERQIK